MLLIFGGSKIAVRLGVPTHATPLQLVKSYLYEISTNKNIEEYFKRLS